MTKGKVVFISNFWEYFGISIALRLLTIITLGIALPYWVYWSFKYFFNKLEIDFYTSSRSNATLVNVQAPASVPPFATSRQLEEAQ